jgi:hypothetical protein
MKSFIVLLFGLAMCLTSCIYYSVSLNHSDGEPKEEQSFLGSVIP